MIHDGLWDAFTDQHMGNCAELLAREYRISRADQDAFAERSYTRALAAMDSGQFAREIVAVEVPNGRGPARRVVEDKMRALRPAFEEGGTVTVANASSISDGAAAVVVASADAARRLGARPIARIVGQAVSATAPEWFTIAPAAAIEKLLAKIGWSKDDVVLAVAGKVGIDLDRVNVNGGAVALGHPVGASGARILTTLLNAMEQRGARRGVAAVCLGGGEAVSLAVERV
jgi:acetyl-CoA C-acetyltransferase